MLASALNQIQKLKDELEECLPEGPVGKTIKAYVKLYSSAVEDDRENIRMTAPMCDYITFSNKLLWIGSLKVPVFHLDTNDGRNTNKVVVISDMTDCLEHLYILQDELLETLQTVHPTEKLTCLCISNPIRPNYIPSGWIGVKPCLTLFGEVPIAVLCFNNEGESTESHPELEVDVGDRSSWDDESRFGNTMFYGNRKRGQFQFVKTIVISIKTDGTTDDLARKIQHVGGFKNICLGYMRNGGDGALLNIHNKFDRGEIGTHQCESLQLVSIYHHSLASHPSSDALPMILAVSVASLEPEDISFGLRRYDGGPTAEERFRHAYNCDKLAEQAAIKFDQAKEGFAKAEKERIEALGEVIEVVVPKRLRTEVFGLPIFETAAFLDNATHAGVGSPCPHHLAPTPSPATSTTSSRDVFMTPPTTAEELLATLQVDRVAAACAAAYQAACSAGWNGHTSDDDDLPLSPLPDGEVNALSQEDPEYMIEEIVSHRLKRGHSRAVQNMLFKVQWKGFGRDHDTYEPWDNIKDTAAVQAYASRVGLELPPVDP
jgi:hypothetical protein